MYKKLKGFLLAFIFVCVASGSLLAWEPVNQGTNPIDRQSVGASGPTGPTGPTGPSGTNGTTGINGAVGPTGPQGADGINTGGAVGPGSYPAFGQYPTGTATPVVNPAYIPPSDFTPVDMGRFYSTEYKETQIFNSGAWTIATAIQAAILPASTTMPFIDQVALPSETTPSGNPAPATINNVPNPQSGEQLYFWGSALFGGGPFTWNVSSGWTKVVCDSSANIACLYTKTVGDDEPSSYSWTISGGAGTISGYVFEVADASGTSGPTSSQAAGAGAPTAPSITTLSDKNLALVCYSGDVSGFLIPNGYNLALDPGTIGSNLVQNPNDRVGGTNSRGVFSNSRTGQNSISSLCAFKQMPTAGATGAAATSAGQVLMAYAGSGGEIDDLNLIREYNDNSVSDESLTVIRDGETTPSIPSVQLQDLVGARNINASTRLTTRYIGFGTQTLGNIGYSEQFYTSMPWTKSMVVEMNNPIGAVIAFWSDIYWHANQFPAAAWNGNAHYIIAPNASYPSADSISPYAEDTLVNISGSGTLWDIVLELNGTGSYNEGRLRIYLNGEGTASIDTSGTEDAFQSSFNWSGLNPPAGSDFYAVTLDNTSPQENNVWRIFGNKEPVSFTSGLKVTWTCGNATIGGVTGNCGVNSTIGYYLNQ